MNGKLNIGTTRLHTDFAHDGNCSIPHGLIFPIRERLRRCYRDRLTRVHPHRIKIFNGTNDDDIVGFVAHDFQLILFPAQHRFFNHDLGYHAGIQT